MIFDCSRRKAHHQQRIGRLGRLASDWWCRYGHKQLTIVLLVENHAIIGQIAIIGLGDQFGTNSNLSRQPNDRGSNFVCHQTIYCAVDIAGIGRVKSAKY
jgi:hypothetical protein